MDPQNVMNISVLKHKKSPTFVQEYADRYNILISDNPTYRSVNITFGRDTAEVVEERLTPTPDGKTQLTASGIEAYRLDVAGISLPEEAARHLAESIIAALSANRPT